MMQESALKGRSRDETETWLLGVLEQEDLPLQEILAALRYHGSAGFDRRVDGWAELVQEALQAAGDRKGLLALLALRSSWRPDSRDFAEPCKSAIEKVFTTRMDKVLLAHCRFDQLPASEAIRRFQLLTSLEKGTLCREKTWGFGVVRRLDDFYKRITIDFDTKRGHEMAFEYAAEVLEILPAGHLLVRLHEDEAAMRKMAVDAPGKLVRLALESYGPLTVDALQERLVDTVVAAGDWKSFWTQARKALKQDPLIFVPPKRSEPLLVLESVGNHMSETFDAFSALRVPQEILKKLDELESAGLLATADPEHLEQVSDRLAFAVWGAGTKEPVVTARALLTAERLHLTGGWETRSGNPVDVAESYRHLLKPGLLKAVLCQLPARMTEPFLARVFALHADLVALHLPDLLPELPVPVLPDAIRHLAQSGNEGLVQGVLAQRLAEKTAGPALVYWLLKEPHESQWRAGMDETELLWQGLDALAHPAMGDQLRAQHLLRALYETPEWIRSELALLRPEQREVFLMKLMQSTGWDEAGRRAVVANVVKAHPELAEAMRKDQDADSGKRARRRMTSWRSFRERQDQFRKLMEVEIPENAKEIAVARSYGDLRENAEYKYAKEHQRILYLRRDEMEQDLERVQGTDFTGFATDCAGMGTAVTIERPDGRKERYCILGEWDRDEGLGIISSLSKLAQALEGHKAGDEVMVPSETGPERCKILSLSEPGDEVQAWLRGGQGGSEA